MSGKSIFIVAIVLVIAAVLFYGGFLQRTAPPEEGPPKLPAAELALREEALRKLYAECLTEMDGARCVRVLGPMAWYPRDGAECEGIGARVDKVIELGGEAKFQDLYKNERCARLDMPYSAQAVAATEQVDPDSAYAPCGDLLNTNVYYCAEAFGRHRWIPHWGPLSRPDRICVDVGLLTKSDLEKYRAIPLRKRPAPDWLGYFRNERCWRKGWESFLVPEMPS